MGYKEGLKIDLPVTIIEPSYTHLRLYIEYAKAYAVRGGVEYVPFCIMVSNDTRNRTLELLERENYFGYKKEWIEIIK